MSGVEIPTGYTPGPWMVGPTDDTVVVAVSDRSIVAEIDGDYNDPDLWPVMEANARLIALAPAMAEELVALRAAVAHAVRELGAANPQKPDEIKLVALAALMDLIVALNPNAHPAALTPETKS